MIPLGLLISFGGALLIFSGIRDTNPWDALTSVLRGETPAGAAGAGGEAGEAPASEGVAGTGGTRTETTTETDGTTTTVITERRSRSAGFAPGFADPSGNRRPNPGEAPR